MFQKMYVDEPDNWIEISEEQARRELEGYYKNVSETLDYIKACGKARTPWAYYRYVLHAQKASVQS